MKKFFVLTWLASLAGLPNSFAASLLSNPGFDLDAPGHSQNLLGWNAYGGNTYNETDAASAHSGSNYFKVYQAFTASVNYSGIYQDYISAPGAVYTADAWAYTRASDALAGQNVAWIEVTFRDATANVLALYRSALIATNALAGGAFPKDQWNHLAVTNQYDPATYQITNTPPRLVAPPGTFFVRCQIVFQGDAHNSGGSVYFDDFNLNRVSAAPYGDMNIVWSDEFNGPAINPSVWTYDTGNNGWGNNELENYTSRSLNAFTSGGFLHLVAQKESYGGSSYTSARLKSQGLFSCRYGRIEWRAKLPQGVGCWPALWLLGTNITSLGWPGCGEIDVMENNGSHPLAVQASIHSGSDATAFYNFPGGDSVTNFHTYTLDWTTNALLFYVDGHLYETQTAWGSSTGNAYPFPFNQPFFFIMNLAIGGNYLGNPSPDAINAGTVFPAEMLVDYIRVYQLTEPFRLAVKPVGANLLLTWPSNIVCHLLAQTNALAIGLNDDWVPLATTSNQIEITAGNGSGFFRLVTP
jgi:beta-glucanase (GH16 family)